MRALSIAVTILSAKVATAAFAAEPAVGIERSEARAAIEPSKASETGIQANLRNQTYDLVRIGASDGKSMIVLVHRQQDLVRSVDVEGFLRKSLAVAVWRVDGRKRKLLFRLKEDAEASHIDEGAALLYTSVYGCCGATDTHTVYSLENGRRLFFAGGEREPYVLGLVRTHPHRLQYVAVHVSGSARDRDIYGGTTTAPNPRRIMVSLAAVTGETDRLVLSYDDELQASPVEEVRWKQSADGQIHGKSQVLSQPVGPSTRPILVIAIRNHKPIEIPIEGDHFLLEDISKPAGMDVVRVSGANGRP